MWQETKANSQETFLEVQIAFRLTDAIFSGPDPPLEITSFPQRRSGHRLLLGWPSGAPSSRIGAWPHLLMRRGERVQGAQVWRQVLLRTRQAGRILQERQVQFDTRIQ